MPQLKQQIVSFAKCTAVFTESVIPVPWGLMLDHRDSQH